MSGTGKLVVTGVPSFEVPVMEGCCCVLFCILFESAGCAGLFWRNSKEQLRLQELLLCLTLAIWDLLQQCMYQDTVHRPRATAPSS